MTAAKLLVQIIVTMMAPAVFRCHPERGGESPPPSSSSLTSPLHGRRVFPLVHGLHGTGGARAPPRLDLSLSVSAFSDSSLSPFLIFPEIRNSDWAEILTRFLFGYQLSCGRRRASTALRVADKGQGRAPCLMATSGTVSRGFFFPKIIYIPKKISISFYPIWSSFDIDILRNKKHATNRNWHWALDQYVSPKNNIKHCQKYMKVVEYWHGTIKNYRYDGDVSASPSLIPARPRVGK